MVSRWMNNHDHIERQSWLAGSNDFFPHTFYVSLPLGLKHSPHYQSVFFKSTSLVAKTRDYAVKLKYDFFSCTLMFVFFLQSHLCRDLKRVKYCAEIRRGKSKDGIWN